MFLKHPFFCALLLLGTGRPCLAARPLLVFLIDGFRHDYMDDLQNLPGFRELVDNGVKVDYMTPDFPSLSFPNYYTLMTGNQSLLTHDIKGFSFITLNLNLVFHNCRSHLTHNVTVCLCKFTELLYKCVCSVNWKLLWCQQGELWTIQAARAWSTPAL